MMSRRILQAPLAALALAVWLHAAVPAEALALPRTMSNGRVRAPIERHSVVGVLMAIACGGSINIARVDPVPIVVVVAGATCLIALVDAWLTPDR
jgi:hypothetical protein